MSDTVPPRDEIEAEGPALIDPDCRDGKCGSCVGGLCQHGCHAEKAPEDERAPEVCSSCGKAHPKIELNDDQVLVNAKVYALAEIIFKTVEAFAYYANNVAEGDETADDSDIFSRVEFLEGHKVVAVVRNGTRYVIDVTQELAEDQEPTSE